MITDLMRNDLGKISTIGSVETLELWRCEAYTNVFHLLSIIRSQIRPEFNPLEIIRSCFPGGSITGCPKLRAMEFIDDLERRPRGVYTGSIGYVMGRGDFDLNIAIRTFVKKEENISLQLGGGIVIDSDPEREYQETLLKEPLFFMLFKPMSLCDIKLYSRDCGKIFLIIWKSLILKKNCQILIKKLVFFFSEIVKASKID